MVAANSLKMVVILKMFDPRIYTRRDGFSCCCKFSGKHFCTEMFLL